MNTTTIASVPPAPSSISAQTIFARLLPGLRLPSREAQLAQLSSQQETLSLPASSMKESWSIAKFPDDRSAVAAICFGYEAPKGPLV